MGEQAISGIFVLSCVYLICNLGANVPISYSREATRFIARILTIVGIDLLLSALSHRLVSPGEVVGIGVLLLSLFIFTTIFRHRRDLQAG